jgi:hypothetical protein
MSKRTFRLILTGYLALEVASSFYNAFFGIRVPNSLVRQLYGVFGQPVTLPQWIGVSLGVISIALFIWAIIGLYQVLAERASRFRGCVDYVWGHRSAQAVLHNFGMVRGAHAPAIAFSRIHDLPCILGPPRQYSAARPRNQSLRPTAGRDDIHV